MRRNIIAMLATTLAVITLSEPLIRAAPVLNGWCCGVTADDCCGCAVADTIAGLYLQMPDNNTYEKCTIAPGPDFQCDQQFLTCINVQNARLYQTQNGSGCASTCANFAGFGNVQNTVMQCLYTYGGCD